MEFPTISIFGHQNSRARKFPIFLSPESELFWVQEIWKISDPGEKIVQPKMAPRNEGAARASWEEELLREIGNDSQNGASLYRFSADVDAAKKGLPPVSYYIWRNPESLC